MKPLLFLFLSLLWVPGAWAGYSNPELKVLILTTSQPFTLSSKSPIQVEGADLGPGGFKRLDFVPKGRGLVQVAHLQTRSTLRLHAQGDWVLRWGNKPAKRYEGFFEVLPFKGGVYLINHLDTETYLEGVLPGEIKTSWSMAAVKAQAVLARTYALYRHHERRNAAWHLKSSTADQMYLGRNSADRRAVQAISETRGIVVSYQGRLAQTFYHSNCGGSTADPGLLWAYSLPYYPIIDVPYGYEDPRYFWEHPVSFEKMSQVLKAAGLKPDRLERVSVNQRTPSGRAFDLILEGQFRQSILAKDFRKYLGYTKLPSLKFEVAETEEGFLFTGQGNGHGVGMCQWAAKEMAEKGYSYQDILHFFYRPIDLGYYAG
ncbi:MAG: SpoIID/LytB domain-containing protein [bacterium]|nr:SpoIID/LytB domain-containing protein [bacterium]